MELSIPTTLEFSAGQSVAIFGCGFQLSPIFVERDYPSKCDLSSGIARALRGFQSLIALEQERLGFVVTFLYREAFAQRAISLRDPVMFFR